MSVSVEECMKRDGRTLDHKALEEIRRMAVQRVREGEKPSVVIASFGFNRRVIYKWLKAAAGPGRDLRALRSTRGTGRARSLTPAQERQVFRWINGRDPRQYGLDFGLRTRRIVALLIKRNAGGAQERRADGRTGGTDAGALGASTAASFRGRCALVGRGGARCGAQPSAQGCGQACGIPGGSDHRRHRLAQAG